MSNDRAGSEDENVVDPTGAEQAADDTAAAVSLGESASDSSDNVAASADNDGIGEADFAPELDDAVDDGDLETVGAVAAGSARAAARRSGARTGVTPGKGAPTRARSDKTEGGNVFSRIGRFLREVVAELRKVIWPSQKQMVTYTIVVILFLVFMIALVAGLDLLFGWGVRSVFG